MSLGGQRLAPPNLRTTSTASVQCHYMARFLEATFPWPGGAHPHPGFQQHATVAWRPEN